LYVNAENPTHSVRAAGEHLVFSGYGHKVGEESDPWSRYESLESWAREHFSISPVEYRWSTQDLFSADKLPLVGQALPGDERLLVATGFAGWGLSNGVAASRLLAGTVLGEEPLSGHRLLTPLRFQAAGAGELLKENLEAGAHFVLDRIKPGEKSEQLKPGEGAIVDDGLKKVALYRNLDGRLSSFSATCPHLGCIVTWNEAERSFDCPCHGSRFNHKGEVLNGPAVTPLKEL
jgi:Rieske Fe-S protein